MVGQLVARPKWVGHHDEQVRPVERQVVVPAVPDDDFRLVLGGVEDVGVVDPGEDDASGIDMGFVLLAFLDRGVMQIEVGVTREPLDALCHEVAIGHRMADDHDPQPSVGQEAGHVAARLALAGAGPDGTDRHHRSPALQHRPPRSEQLEVGAGRHRTGSGVHDGLVTHIAVGEHDRVDALLGDDPTELRLGVDRDALGISRAGQCRRVAPIGDARDLGRREGDDRDTGILAVDDVEVVKIAPCCTHDQDPLLIHRGTEPFRRGWDGRGEITRVRAVSTRVSARRGPPGQCRTARRVGRFGVTVSGPGRVLRGPG